MAWHTDSNCFPARFWHVGIVEFRWNLSIIINHSTSMSLGTFLPQRFHHWPILHKAPSPQLNCPPPPVDPHWRRFESIRTLWGSQNPNHKTTATFSLPKQFRKATYAQPNLLGCKSLQPNSILHHCMSVITIPSYPWSCCSRSQTFPDMQRHTKQIRHCSSTQVGTKWISQHP